MVAEVGQASEALPVSSLVEHSELDTSSVSGCNAAQEQVADDTVFFYWSLITLTLFHRRT